MLTKNFALNITAFLSGLSFSLLLDTPGVMPPNIEREEHGLWLSAIHAIPDAVVGEEMPAQFIIKHFLKFESQEFKVRYKFENFEISLEDALLHIAKRGAV